MGGGSSKEKQMRKDIRSLRSCTHFTMEELAGLMEQFNSISSRREDDGWGAADGRCIPVTLLAVVHVKTHIHTHIYIYICVYTHTHVKNMCIRVQIHECINAHAYT